MRENIKGITLVALVITIIILLILAGITISQLTGSGLFENAKAAEEKTKNAQELEEKVLDDHEKKISEILNGNRNTNINVKDCSIEVSDGGKITVKNVESMKIYSIIRDGKYEESSKENGYVMSKLNSNRTGDVYVIAIDEDGNIYKSNTVAYQIKDLFLYNYGDRGTAYSSGWDYIGGRYYPTSYAKHNSDNIEFYYGGYIGTVLKDDYLEDYKYLCIKSTSEVIRNSWTAFQVLLSQNFDTYSNENAWMPHLSYYPIVNHEDTNTWKETTTYIDLTEELDIKSRYLVIQFCEGRDGYIHQIYLTNEKQ